MSQRLLQKDAWGLTKGTISPSYPPSDLRPADKVPNGPDTTIKPTVPVSAAKKQQFLPQTDEESDGILQVFGSLGFVVVAWYWMKKNQVRRHNQKN
ncbi:hypothetical protein [Pediococcus damnosus]|uniref:hypothetical protein n=1 Tax=Pediococcus damnosus TaxID=51663 RepID=UPI00070504F4|nr:hypothetical protein [Pediococcus damnosus]KRN47415.1 hypothetical protein IV84_GL001835 [Pediococcus damnosus]